VSFVAPVNPSIADGLKAVSIAGSATGKAFIRSLKAKGGSFARIELPFANLDLAYC
jgi:hypothetical protein